MITEKDARAGAARDMGILAELDFQIRDNHKLTSEVGRLEDENAKLRELCKAWYEFSYELFDEFIGEPEMNDDFMALDDRMRKLRVYKEDDNG